MALLLAVVLVAAIVAAVWLLVAQPWAAGGADPRPSPSRSTPSATPSSTEATPPEETSEDPAAPAEPESAPTAEACAQADVRVDAVTDADTYASGANPQLSISLSNTTASDCTINVGTTGQVFTIMSGSDVWWRSTDCQTEPSDMVVTLAAGQSFTSATPVTWNRTRSSVSTCGEGASRQNAPGGGASYHLTVEIGGIPSSDSKQFILY